MAAREGLFQKTAEEYLQAIDRYNSQTNAVLLKLADLALEQARKADEADARGEWLGLLHGVCGELLILAKWENDAQTCQRSRDG